MQGVSDPFQWYKIAYSLGESVVEACHLTAATSVGIRILNLCNNQYQKDMKSILVVADSKCLESTAREQCQI